MRSSHGYRLAAKSTKQRRPAGVAVLAVLGVLGSLSSILFALVRLIGLTRVTVEPSLPIAALVLELVVALIVLWINWGFWELIGWAWWGNLIVLLLSVAGCIGAVRFLPAIVDVLARLTSGFDERQLTSGALVVLIAGLAYNLIAIVYMISVHAVFKVGVKDVRPLWERVRWQ